MATAKTRFLALQSGIVKQLLSVEEKKSGDLLLGLNPPKNMRFNGLLTEKPKGRKISVHISPLSDPPAHTITHEVWFGLRKSHKGFAVVRKIADSPFIWPIFCQFFGTNEPKFINRHKHDTLRHTVSYDASHDSLLLAVLVTTPPYVIPEAHGLSVTVSRHDNFNINLVTTFADVRSTKSTFDIFDYTSDVKDGNFLGIIGGRKSADTFGVKGLEEYLLSTFMFLAQKVKNANRQLVITPSFSNTQMRRFGRFLNGISVDELMYGEHSIAMAQRHTPKERMDPRDVDSPLFSKISDNSPYELSGDG